MIEVYVNGNLDGILEKLRGWMEEKREGERVIIVGDFNVRTGEEWGRVRYGDEGEEETGKRNSKDKKRNGEGRKLCTVLAEVGWEILNGDIEGDEDGEWTYTGGRGNSVIDYVLGNGDSKERIENVIVGDRIDSDHQPLIVSIQGGRKGGKRKRVERKKRARLSWTETRRKKFQEMFRRGGGGGGLEEVKREGRRNKEGNKKR